MKVYSETLISTIDMLHYGLKVFQNVVSEGQKIYGILHTKHFMMGLLSLTEWSINQTEDITTI